MDTNGVNAMYTLFIRPVRSGVFLLCRLKHIQFLHSVGSQYMR